MNWEATAAIAELLGAVGVIASLVYLAGQVRSTGNQARQAAIQSVVNKMSTVWNHLTAETTGDLWVRGSRGLSELESLIAQRMGLSAIGAGLAVQLQDEGRRILSLPGW